MPTYEYRCTSCAQRFEIQQSFKDDALTVCDQAVAAGAVVCPRSGGGELKKVFHAVGIAFKGSGFYKTDSRGTSSSGASSSAGGGSGSGSGDGSGSSGGGASSGAESSGSSSTGSSPGASGSSTSTPAPASTT